MTDQPSTSDDDLKRDADLDDLKTDIVPVPGKAMPPDYWPQHIPLDWTYDPEVNCFYPPPLTEEQEEYMRIAIAKYKRWGEGNFDDDDDDEVDEVDEVDADLSEPPPATGQPVVPFDRKPSPSKRLSSRSRCHPAQRDLFSALEAED